MDVTFGSGSNRMCRVAVLALLLICGHAAAQIVPVGADPASTAPSSPKTPPAAPTAATTPVVALPAESGVGSTPIAGTITVNQAWLNEFAGRSIARIALMDARVRVPPSADDLAITLGLLRVARTYLPTDAELLRLEIETASVAGDQQSVLDATRELVKLDPSDSVAQLRLISARITEQQTAEARLALYDRLLGAGGNSLDGSIRSRLALDAALLARERGDDRLFAERLKQALALDSTNKEAALLALSEYSSRVNDAVGRAQLLSNLILADPLDPQVQRQFAQELARGGAYPQARRFLNLAETLFNLGQFRPDEHFDIEMWISRWAVEGGQDVIRELDKRTAAARYQAESQNRRAEKDPTISRTDLNEVRLSPVMERMRVIVADAIGDSATLDAIRADMTASERLVLDVPNKLDRSTPADQAANVKMAAGISILEYQILRLWFNLDIDQVAANVESAISFGVSEESPTLKSIRAWQMLREGKAQEALDAFMLLQDAQFEVLRSRAIGDIEPSRIGAAMALEGLGRHADAAEMYRQLSVDRCLDAVGLWAAARLERMGGTNPVREQLSRRLADVADAIPRFLEDMASSPNAFMAMTVTSKESTISGTDPILLTIRLRNRSKIALGVGTDRPINTQLLLQPGVDIQTAPMAMFASPEPVTLDRRFRLGPGETMEFTVWADPGYTGWLAQSGIARAVRQRFRVIQGYMPSERGEMMPGPTCLTADSGSIVRIPLREALISPIELTEQIRSAPVSIVPLLAAAARAQFGVTVKLAPGLDTPVLASIPPGISAGECQTVAQALAARYASLDVRGRILLLSTLPNHATFSELQPFDDAAKLETDDAVVPFMLITRVADPADPALDRAMSSANTFVAKVASVHRDRLSKGTSDTPAKTIATLGMYPAIDRAAGKQAGKLDGAGEELKEKRGGSRRTDGVAPPPSGR
jgi:hypothetical protein